MLGRILDGKTCASCRICCVYDDSDVWDAPGFTKEEWEKNRIADRFPYHQGENGLYYLDMEKDNEGLYTCPCLSDKGCTLGKTKPFRCALWPLYLVPTEEGVGIALSLVCPQVQRLSNAEILEGISEALPLMLERVKADPALLEPFSEEYRMVALPDGKGDHPLC